jgi:transcriptional regulator with XRE-family HTH domain
MLPIIATRLDDASVRLRNAIGGVIRAARRQRGLTLREVASLSGYRFKASALGGYERGERMISLERFCDLSALFGIPADRLLSAVLDRIAPEGRAEVVVNLGELERLQGQEPRRAAELVARVQRQRDEESTDEVALRAGDLEALALASDLTPADLIQRLEPAVRIRRPSGQS